MFQQFNGNCYIGLLADSNMRDQKGCTFCLGIFPDGSSDPTTNSPYKLVDQGSGSSDWHCPYCNEFWGSVL